MVNQVAKFLSKLDDATLRTKSKEKFILFGAAHQKAFTNLPVLSYNNPNHKTVVAADSLFCGLVGVLLQKDDDKLKSICSASRSLTATE